MSMYYCEECDRHIDIDYDAEHFDLHNKNFNNIVKTVIAPNEISLDMGLPSNFWDD